MLVGDLADNGADRSKPNGNHAGTSKSSVSSKTSDISPWKNIGAVPRDPKSRARSREYLKQCVYSTVPLCSPQADQFRCLQEITYLTSPGALNPLPNRPLLSELDQSSPQSAPIEPEPERPIKALPSKSIPSQFTRPKEEERPAAVEGSAGLPNGDKPEPNVTAPPADSSSDPPLPVSDAPLKSHLSNIASSENPPSSPHVSTKGLPDTDDPTQAEAGPQETNNGLLTAIYRPESKAAWLDTLRAANEKATRVSRVPVDSQVLS